MNSSKKYNILFSENKNLSDEDIAEEPVKYTLQVSRKQLWKILTKSFNYWLELPEDKLTFIEVTFELIHTAVSLLEEIEYGTIVRNGLPAIYTIFGTARIMVAAHYVLYSSMDELMDLDNMEVVGTVNENLQNFMRGKAMELYWKDHFLCPTEDEYKIMCIKKTGSFFNMTLRSMQLFSGKKYDFTKLSRMLGICHQICEDYRNLQFTGNMKFKSFCKDFTEGRFSFPIIHAIRSRPEDSRVINILRQRANNNELKEYAVFLLDEYGSLQYTVDVLRKLRHDIEVEVKSLGANPHMEEILNILFEFIPM